MDGSARGAVQTCLHGAQCAYKSDWSSVPAGVRAFWTSRSSSPTVTFSPATAPGLDEMFSATKPVIAMVHGGPLPGTPASRLTVRELERVAVAETRIYRDAGVHGIIIENVHDVPYLQGKVGPEITTAMTVLSRAVKAESGHPSGI